MYYTHCSSLVGHLLLEARLRPISFTGHFRIGSSEAILAASQKRFENALLVIGTLLVLPGALGLVLALLKSNLGMPNLYNAAFSSAAFVVLAKVSLFLGTPLALLSNLLAIIHVRVARQHSGISTSVTLEPTLAHLPVLAIALLVLAFFFGLLKW